MHANALLPLVSVLALTAHAAPVVNEEAAAAATTTKRAACSSYTIINTRGTGEPQGQSASFSAINRQVTAQRPGGKVYNTVYPASADQVSTVATADILQKISTVLQANPAECFLLQGYSQGAAATVAALGRISGASADAVRGVFLTGNPTHKAGLACNVDVNGGDTTKNVNGLSAALGSSVPQSFIGKTLDVCAYGDGVCDTTHGAGFNAAHLTYLSSSSAQKLGTDFAVKQLSA